MAALEITLWWNFCAPAPFVPFAVVHGFTQGDFGMTTVDSTLARFGFGVAKKSGPWKVAPAVTARKAPPRRSWLTRFQRPQPTTYQRCLAVHILYAAPRSGLS